ncbi:PAQR family membrane homeostasis protein TrhA [Legionella cincinnatiensis]|uniref:Hemolysin, inner membrane subunit n=1 Tax=Legionella cincinnatiensis TaxID=28085 RepID=A0A378IFT2_9GAMM|nr:hemolysin III family protein [Legionella cincinnatiensis]KTC93600.1 hemolysin, inner membrane subunit [Legionella cincinnatiensis]STX34069.1 hemolysin, inner membrane subunit [Legionella cincinnatiensis]
MKPLARGYIHLAAFFITLCACTILIIYSNGAYAIFASVTYSISLIGQYGVSALYHTRMWTRQKYLLLRRIDHAAIFVLIAGSATPICLLKLKNASGLQLLFVFWLVAIIGMLITTLWTHVPKWSRAVLYVAMGWIGILYFPEIKSSLDTTNIQLLVIGGVAYTLGALIYAFKWPDPFPSVFGYHEVFHVFVVLGSGLHFCLNYNIAT